MLKNLYTRILTNYPLLWNTRVIWVIGISLIIHLLFFLAGFAGLTVEALKEYSSLTSVITGSVLTFSMLCSLVVIIVWLVFYLRNNAFKNFYIIDKYHSVKEFFIIFLIVFFASVFFESYKLGAWLRTRTITSQQQLVKEVNILNLASAFIPLSKSDYFKLKDCDDPAKNVDYQDNVNYFDTTSYLYDDSISIIIRKVLNDKDAFSYKNYCSDIIKLKGYNGFVPANQWREKRNRWIDNKNKDSIRQVLEQCVAICKKYNIEQDLQPAELTRLVFADSFHNVTRFLRSYPGEYNNYNQVDYFKNYDLTGVLRFIDECHLNSNNEDNWLEIFTIEIYVALSLSIFLFCYRLFSRRVFLFSIVGSIVWCIIFALTALSSKGDDTSAWLYIILFALFILVAIISLKDGSSKTATGVLLNWQAYMLPFVIMILVFLIADSYRTYEYRNGTYWYFSPEELKKRYPVAYWVDKNSTLLIRLNILLVILYMAFFFTRLSKKWHIMPEE